MLQITPLNTALAAGSSIISSQGKDRPFADEASKPQTATEIPRDSTRLSPQGLKASRENQGQNNDGSATRSATDTAKVSLTAEELKQLSQLKSRDREVRAHEQAHLSVAGQHAAGGASFTYQRGPDGNSYAVGGEVPIDISGESTPEATIQKMRTIRRAALAPAEPSGADRQIASQASTKELQARQEIAAELQKNLSGILSADSEGKTAVGVHSQPIADVSSPEISVKNSSRKMMIAAYQSMGGHDRY